MDCMELGELLSPSAVALDVTAGSQKAVFDRAAAMLAGAEGGDPAGIAAALGARERLGTTGFGGGTAIPHGRVIGVTGVRGAVLRLLQPLDWGGVDGIPVDLVFALVGPAGASVDQLKALARVSRALRDKALVEKLRGANDAGALWALLVEQEQRAA
jgi:PTS system nitrogen regulatory IIA component